MSPSTQAFIALLREAVGEIAASRESRERVHQEMVRLVGELGRELGQQLDEVRSTQEVLATALVQEAAGGDGEEAEELRAARAEAVDLRLEALSDQLGNIERAVLQVVEVDVLERRAEVTTRVERVGILKKVVTWPVTQVIVMLVVLAVLQVLGFTGAVAWVLGQARAN